MCHARIIPSPKEGSMKTNKILAGIAGILALLALFGIGASATTLLAIAVVLLAAMVFIR